MSEASSQLPEGLRRKFPDLRPIKTKPVLFRMNGIGASVYGKRDQDVETGTYIKTHCLCVLFIPVFALGAYRVADAPRGWYFIGKERLSSFAKSWNWGVLGLALLWASLAADHAYRTSPDYLARQELKQAQAAMTSGQALKAAGLYRQVAQGEARAAEGRRGLQEALEKCLTSEAPKDVQGAYQILTALPRPLNTPQPLVPNAFQRGMGLVEKFEPQDPEGALEILRQVAKLGGPTNNAVQPLEIQLLKATLAAHPDKTNRVEELALLYEDQHQMEDCYALLRPYQQKLGASEGARILGQHLLNEGKYDEAYGLLHPYVQSKLAQLHAVERTYTNAVAGSYKRALAYLNDGRAERSFYDDYKQASKLDKERLVEAFVDKWMRSDAALRRAEGELTSAKRIVTVTLDLGIVQLNRAQALRDPAARKAELEAAEQSFLSIRGLAGNTDEYRLYLGQVYYWLGKPTEGKALFDKLLVSHKRAYPLLMSLGRTLREVGEEDQARALTEEAYRTAKTDTDKYNAASLRAHIFKDLDDHIAWLEKSGTNDNIIQIALDSARGDKALQAGNRTLAAQFLRKAIAGYEKVPQNAVSLNNCGLVYLDLYRITGNLEDHNRGLALMEKAVALEPGNSLLLMNMTQLLLVRAHMDVIGDAIHFGALKEPPDHSMLMLLYRDEATREPVIQQLRQDDYLKKTLTYLDKALLLAPKSERAYHMCAEVERALRDPNELQKVQQRLTLAHLDPVDARRAALETYQASRDKENVDHLQAAIQRYQALLQDPSVKEHPLTREYAEVTLNGCRQALAMRGAAVDTQQVLSDALAIHQRHPTAASSGLLLAAYFLRANEELKQQSPEYAQMAEQTHRALPPMDLIAFLLERDGPLAKVLRQNANVAKALEIIKEEEQLFPSHRSLHQWALLRATESDHGARLAQEVQADKFGRLADAIDYALSPDSGSEVLSQYWTHKLTGDDAGAVQVYQHALQEGVPLPAL